MLKITIDSNKYGPYSEVLELEDRYRCDGADLPFNVIGKGVISEATTEDFPPIIQQKDPLVIQKEIVDSTQQRLDAFAKTHNYDSILSACTYATSTVLKFQTEGQYCVDVRDNTWATLYQIMQEVQQGTRPAPSGYADIEADLPVLAWPN